MTASNPSRGLHIGLWVAQVLLALMFTVTGGFKLFGPMEELLRTGLWVRTTPAALVRFIGFVEISGALGLILPSATRLKPGLTPLAAAGLATVMVLAFGKHAMIGDLGQFAPVNATLFLVAAFVAWGRWKKAPIPPKQSPRQ